MPTTGDVLDQHLKCFGENDLDSVVADYSSDAVLFVPHRPLKGPDAIKPFFRFSLRSWQSRARRFRCVSDTLKVNPLPFCGAEKQQIIRTKLVPTPSLCGTARSWRSPLPPRLPQALNGQSSTLFERANKTGAEVAL
jgi:hypothetical protein